jgi:hypothetical protein
MTRARKATLAPPSGDISCGGLAREMVAMSERGSWVEAVALLGSLAIALSLGGCAALPRRPAVPERMTEAAAPPGIPNARYW